MVRTGWVVLWFACWMSTEARGADPIEDALALRLSIDVSNESFQSVADDLAKRVQKRAPQFEIKVLAKDLQLEGITRNQAIRNLRLEDATVAEILTALVVKGNPLPAGQATTDANQKLVWVVGADPENRERRVVLITTRAAAKARGAELPAPFVKKKS